MKEIIQTIKLRSLQLVPQLNYYIWNASACPNNCHETPGPGTTKVGKITLRIFITHCEVNIS